MFSRVLTQKQEENKPKPKPKNNEVKDKKYTISLEYIFLNFH